MTATLSLRRRAMISFRPTSAVRALICLRTRSASSGDSPASAAPVLRSVYVRARSSFPFARDSSPCPRQMLSRMFAGSLIAVVLLAGCKPSPENLLVGTWKVQGGGDTPGVWIYRADHTLEFQGYDELGPV